MEHLQSNGDADNDEEVVNHENWLQSAVKVRLGKIPDSRLDADMLWRLRMRSTGLSVVERLEVQLARLALLRRLRRARALGRRLVYVSVALPLVEGAAVALAADARGVLPGCLALWQGAPSLGAYCTWLRESVAAAAGPGAALVLDDARAARLRGWAARGAALSVAECVRAGGCEPLRAPPHHPELVVTARVWPAVRAAARALLRATADITTESALARAARAAPWSVAAAAAARQEKLYFISLEKQDRARACTQPTQLSSESEPDDDGDLRELMRY